MNMKLMFLALIASAAACRMSGSVTADGLGAAGNPADAGLSGLPTTDAGFSGSPAADAGVSDAGTEVVIPPYPGASLVAAGPVRELEVAPDGKHALFVREDRFTNCHYGLGRRSALLWLVDTKGGSPTQLGGAADYSFSPEGSRIATLQGDCVDWAKLVSYRSDGTGPFNVGWATGIQYSGETLYGTGVRWDPWDGTRWGPSDPGPVQLPPSLLSSDPLGLAAYSCDRSTGRCLYFPDAMDVKSAVALDASGTGPAEWTTDGQWMVLADVAVSRDGRRQHRVGDGRCMQNEGVTPDGRAVAYARLPSGTGCDGMMIIHPLLGGADAEIGPLPARLEDPRYRWKWGLSRDQTRLLVFYESVWSSRGVLVAAASGGPFEELLPESYAEYTFTVAADGSLYSVERDGYARSLIHRRPGATPQTMLSANEICPPARDESSGAMLFPEVGVSGSRLHWVDAGGAWISVTVPGTLWCRASGAFPFYFGFVGRTPVYLTASGHDADLVAIGENGESSVLAPRVSMFRVVGTSVYVVRSGDLSLWRIEVP